ncbi:MAG: DUF488 domain-containing protein [Dehalococcoidia bacterium]|nr:DUF488 domain-containing protein [Dehalococcoidia bacterium]
MNHLFTLGHSTHSIGDFVDLLQKHEVSSAIDVRSNPYSQYTPQFNRQAIEQALGEFGIAYEFAGDSLGARSADPQMYKLGVVNFGALSTSAAFNTGIRRIEELSADQRIAIVCTEKDPVTCHRGVLVARSLVDKGFAIDHILADGELESHSDMEDRMVTESGLPYATLFDDHQEIVKQAYSIIGRRIAWKDPEYVEPSEAYLEH